MKDQNTQQPISEVSEQQAFIDERVEGTPPPSPKKRRAVAEQSAAAAGSGNPLGSSHAIDGEMPVLEMPASESDSDILAEYEENDGTTKFFDPPEVPPFLFLPK